MGTRRNNKRPRKHGRKTRSRRQKGGTIFTPRTTEELRDAVRRWTQNDREGLGNPDLKREIAKNFGGKPTRKNKRTLGGGPRASKPIATPLSHETPILIDTPNKRALAFLVAKKHAEAEIVGNYYPDTVAYKKNKNSKKGGKKGRNTRKKK